MALKNGMSEYNFPNWLEAFDKVCRRGEKTLEWGLPEQWVHAELFAALKEASPRSGWTPFSTELPYLTHYPVALPKAKNRDWRQKGAIKWADLCLTNSEHNSWCWFELKVRHTGSGARESTGAYSALDAVAKDYVGLCGFDPKETGSIWMDPDQFTKAYWFEEILGPHANNLPYATHCFASAYLQIGSSMNETIIDRNLVQERINSWFAWRSKNSKHNAAIPDPVFTFTSSLVGGHSLLICESIHPGKIDS